MVRRISGYVKECIPSGLGFGLKRRGTCHVWEMCVWVHEGTHLVAHEVNEDASVAVQCFPLRGSQMNSRVEVCDKAYDTTDVARNDVFSSRMLGLQGTVSGSTNNIILDLGEILSSRHFNSSHILRETQFFE